MSSCDTINRPLLGKLSGRFIRSSSWDWMMASWRLGFPALRIALALWHLYGLKKSNPVKLTAAIRKEIGLDRSSCSRALKLLSEAGLVQVQRLPGKPLMVTILEFEQ